MIEKENLVELAKRYNITGFATAIKVVESLSQENIRLSEENKLLKSDLENDTNDYWLKKVFELESENKKLSEGLTIAYMSGVADEKERSRALEEENIRLKEAHEYISNHKNMFVKMCNEGDIKIIKLESEVKALKEEREEKCRLAFEAGEEYSNGQCCGSYKGIVLVDFEEWKLNNLQDKQQ